MLCTCINVLYILVHVIGDQEECSASWESIQYSCRHVCITSSDLHSDTYLVHPHPTIGRCTHTQTTKFKNWNIRSSVEECGAKFIRGFKLKAIIVWRIVIGRSLYVEQIAFFNPEKSTTCQHSRGSDISSM